MSLLDVQGEGVGEEKLRREQTEQTEKDLQAQMEDNKRRHMEDKHKGEKRQTLALLHRDTHTHGDYWAPVNHIHASCFPAQTITHSHTQPLVPGDIDGCSS